MLEAEANDPQDHAFGETDFQHLRDAVNSGDSERMLHIALAKMWPSFVRAHPEEGWRLFKKLAKDKDRDVRWGAAVSPAWPMLLETHNAEAWQLLEKLATDEHFRVKRGAAMSPAWPTLLETRNAEAWLLFEKLAKDEVAWVRRGAAESPAWPGLVRSNVWERWQLFTELMSDPELMAEHESDRKRLADSPGWEAFGAVPRTAVAEHLNSSTPANLQEMATSVQKVADNGFIHKVKDLPVVKGLAATLQRSSNETWLGEMAQLPLFAGDAALRASLAENV